MPPSISPSRLLIVVASPPFIPLPLPFDNVAACQRRPRASIWDFSHRAWTDRPMAREASRVRTLDTSVAANEPASRAGRCWPIITRPAVLDTLTPLGRRWFAAMRCCCPALGTSEGFRVTPADLGRVPPFTGESARRLNRAEQEKETISRVGLLSALFSHSLTRLVEPRLGAQCQ